jgi:hypothetical protein
MSVQKCEYLVVKCLNSKHTFGLSNRRVIAGVCPGTARTECPTSVSRLLNQAFVVDLPDSSILFDQAIFGDELRFGALKGNRPVKLL